MADAFFLRISTRMMRLRKRSIGLIILIFIILSASIAYLLEPSTFHNWFNAFYWVMTTMATVGYGDYFAETVVGKLFTMFLYILGLVFSAWLLARSLTLLQKCREGEEQEH